MILSKTRVKNKCYYEKGGINMETILKGIKFSTGIVLGFSAIKWALDNLTSAAEDDNK